MHPIPTLAAWYDEWEASRRHQLEASLLRSYRWMADSYLLPHLGDHHLDELTVRGVEAVYARLLAGGGRGGRPLAPRTVAYAHAVLHRCLVDAVRLEVIPSHPLRAVTVPTRPTGDGAPTPLRVWDASQVRTFLAAVADHPLADVWTLALTTGLRRGELCGLRHGDVDLDAATLTVATSIAEVDGKLLRKAPKTGRQRRLSLDPVATAVLTRRRAAAEDDDPPVGPVAQRPLVPGSDGGPLRPTHLTDQWRRLVPTLDLPPIRLHDLRHTHATLLLSAGVPVKVVAERLGHAKVAMTLDIYAHVLPAQDRAAATAMGALLTGPR